MVVMCRSYNPFMAMNTKPPMTNCVRQRIFSAHTNTNTLLMEG